MELPAYMAEEACARLRADQTPATLRRILKLLEMDLVEPSGPDFDDLARRFTPEVPENERRGSVTFSGELSLFGLSVPVHFRYSYVAEYGEYPEAFDGFGVLGSVAHLDALDWSADGRQPEWTQFVFGVLSRPMMDAIDELVLDQVAAKSNI